MKKLLKKTLSIIFIGTIITTSCNSPAKKVEKAQENLEVAEIEYTQAYKDSVDEFMLFRNTMESRIESNEVVINKYKIDMKENNSKAKSKDQKIIDDLEQKNINMRKRIEEYNKTGREEWDAFKKEFNYDMDELGKSLKNLTIRNTK
jgi:hypothetical protein